MDEKTSVLKSSIILTEFLDVALVHVHIVNPISSVETGTENVYLRLFFD